SGMPSGLLAYKLLIFVGQFHDRFYAFDILSMLAIAALYLFARSNGAFVVPSLGAPAIVIALAAIFMPKILSGSALADYRIAPVSALLFFLSLRSGSGRRDGLAVAFALALTVVRLGVTGTGWHQDTIAYERHLEALNAVPMG